MADVTSTLTSWSSTAASNLPANSAAVGPNTLADNQRVIQAVVRAALAGDGTIASATTTDLSTVNDGDITVTGTTTITGFGTLTAGIKKVLTFSGTLILTHNATSLILPGAANITTAAGDVAIMRSLGSGNWKCIAFTSITGNVATATNATNATNATTTTPIKLQCRAATTANITLAGSAPNTLDGVTLAANDRILVKAQSTGSQNGIYYVSTLGTGANGTWTRATDADGAGELLSGMLVTVSEGTVNADSMWMLTTNDPITIGTTALTFERKDAGAAVTKQIQSISSSVAANALTVNLAATTLDFRNATLANGAPIAGVSVGALSLTVPSTATLGTVNGVAARLVLLVAYNAGAPVLCIGNLAGGLNLDETNLISPTTISTGSDSNNVIYSASAVSANSPYRVVGFRDSTEATAGTWVTAPTLEQGIGGQALAALSSLGYGQTWQGVTRTSGTTYYNTTGKPIALMGHATTTAGGTGTIAITINGASINLAYLTAAGASNALNASMIVIPPQVSYVLTETNIATRSIFELR